MTADIDILKNSVKQAQPKRGSIAPRRKAERPTATETAIGIVGIVSIFAGFIIAFIGVARYTFSQNTTPPTLNSSPYVMLIYIGAGLQLVVYGILFCAADHGLRYLRQIAGRS